MLEIIREQDELNRKVWKFWPDTGINKVDIILDRYSVQSRPTKRHKWRTVTAYDRTSRKRWSQEGYMLIDISEVPVLPSDVVEEVIAKFMATVTIKRER
jgi:hypothetical protein